MRPPRHATLAVLALASTVVAGTLVAERERFWESTDVTVVEIPVQVVRSGKPVTGLTADDFELFDGKKRQQITGFETIDLAQIEATAGSSSMALEVPAMARRHFLFLFDLSFSEPASMTRARDAALELVGTGLHATDLAAVGVYSRSQGARLMLGFTSDRNQVRLAIETLGAPELVDRAPDSLGIVFGQARATLESILDGTIPDGEHDQRSAREAAAIDFFQSFALAEKKAQESNQRNRVTDLSRSFEEMANLLARVKGRKQVLYFSEGFQSDLMLGRGKDTDTAEAAQRGDIWNVDSDAVFGSTGLQNDLEGMLESFRRSDAVIQSIDIGGARAINTVQTIGNVGGVRIEGDPFADRSTGQDGLFFMANETGGELFRNFNDLTEAMGKVLARTSVTYLLAFQPKDLLPDGSYRKVRVKLRSGIKGAKLVHRSGYYAPKLWSQQTPLEKRLSNADLVLGRRQGGSIGLAVTAAAIPGAPRTSDGKKAIIPYVVEIDGPGLIRAHRGDLLNGEIHVYAIDDQGTVHAFHNQMLGMNLAKTRKNLDHTGIKFCGQLALPPGRFEVRALVRNNGALTYGLESGSVVVPDFEVENTSPPLFVEPTGDWVMVSANAAGPSAPYPWMTGDQMWVPIPRANLDAGQPTMVWLDRTLANADDPIAGVVRPHGVESGPGHRVALAIKGREQMPTGTERLLLDFTTPSLPPGAYTLELELSGQTTLETPVRNTSVAFSISG